MHESATADTVNVERDERLLVIDALRGFALFGVIVANTVGLLGFNPFFNPSLVEASRDRAAFTILMTMIDGRFMAMYSLLFGVGFGILASRAVSNESAFVHVYLRRAAVLFLIGVANYVVLGAGDVLHLYALLAVVVLSVRNASTRTLIVLAIACLFLPAIGRTMVDAFGIVRSPGIDPALVQRLRAEGPSLELLELRITGFPRQWWVILNSTHLLSLFVAGLLVARHRLLHESENNKKLLIAVLIIGTLVTAVGFIAQPAIVAWTGSTPAPWRYVVTAVSAMRTMGQMFAYVAAFLLLWRFLPVRRLLGRLAPAGRLALTNYLLLNVIVGAGLFILGGYGNVGPAAGCAIGVAIWVGMVLASRWWIGRFRMGPAEWVWQSLTYGRRLVIGYLTAASRLGRVGTPLA